jgi:hypothetical protein
MGIGSRIFQMWTGRHVGATPVVIRFLISD